MGEEKPSPLAASRVRLQYLGEDKPSPLAASRVRLQCLGESTDGEVIDPVKGRSY